MQDHESYMLNLYIDDITSLHVMEKSIHYFWRDILGRLQNVLFIKLF